MIRRQESMMHKSIYRAQRADDSKGQYKIEAKKDELKNRHGMKLAEASGLFGIEIQGATAIFSVNLKRFMKRLDAKEVQ